MLSKICLSNLFVRYSINNLRSFPWLKQREDAGQLTLHGTWFDIESGELWVMDKQTGDFSRAEYNFEKES